MINNDMTKVYRLDALNASLNSTVVNNITGNHASFVNACFCNLSVVNFNADLAVLNSCNFPYNVCINNCSMVNLDISGNMSFQSFKTPNSSLQTLYQSYSNVSTLNLSTTLWNVSAQFFYLSTFFNSVSVGYVTVHAWNTSAQLNNLTLSYWNISHSNLSTVAWNTSSLLNNLSQTFYSVSVGNVSACAWNTSAQLNNLSLSYWNISHYNLTTVAWNTSTQLSNLSTTCASINTSLINVRNIIDTISLVNLSVNC